MAETKTTKKVAEKTTEKKTVAKKTAPVKITFFWKDGMIFI